MLKLRNSINLFGDDDLFETLSKFKEADCILYSEEGTKVKIHKEILCQTRFMKNVLLKANRFCCGNTEIFCPCPTDELEVMVKFLYSGKISLENEPEMIRIQENLTKLFGFDEKLFLNSDTRKPID